jgi:uncharacterized protein (DUF2235 family)
MNEDDSLGRRQRLVVFLDGTWNDKDDCTNVLNLYNLVKKGPVGDGFFQRKMYDAGVGTGVLDSVSGGAFGNGLETNVREAYDWLVEHFDDEGMGQNYQADEIYIFGFSRGAYTARSLAGFIARCGLLRRGAPLTVGQLWEGYGELERHRNDEETTFDRLLGQNRFRQLEELVWDPWLGGELRDAKIFNDTEKLLIRWSRRVKITFIGVYDTVGAMGIDALAIPGLRGQAGRMHNMRPSSIFLNFRHALGIDENRSSFQHTPLLEFRPHDREPKPRGGLLQRWFVGAHSNVGGGYPDNALAEPPLDWMLREAVALGLRTQPLDPREEPGPALRVPPAAPRDSYAEFAWPVGVYLLRTKRNFRRIAPPDEPRAKRGEVARRFTEPQPGFSLHSNETVDASVWEYAAANPRYAPPNLVEYAGRAKDRAPAMKEVAGRAVVHDWPPRLAGGSAWLFLWSILAGIGAIVFDWIFQIFPGSAGPRDWIAAGVVATLAVLVDWGESRLKLKLAACRGEVWERALADAIFWTRSILVIFFVAGIWGLFSLCWVAGWNFGGEARRMAFYHVADVGQDGVLLVALPLLALILLLLLDRRLGPVKEGKLPPQPPAAGAGRRLLAAAGWLAAAAAVAGGLILLGQVSFKIVDQAWGPVGKLEGWGDRGLGSDPTFAGHFLFLLVSLAYLVKSWSWVGAPMSRANLGSMAALMFKPSGAAVARVRERWQRLLFCGWAKDPEDCARAAVRAAVKEGLWRDIVGLVPVYNIVFLFAFYFLARDLGVAFLEQPLPLWWMIPLATASADWIETAIHLSYLRGEKEFEPVGNLRVWIAWLATAVKTAGFLAGALVSVWAFVWAGQRILIERDFYGGWRGALAGTILLALAVFAASRLWAIGNAFLVRRRRGG